jgi:hypothetical protein
VKSTITSPTLSVVFKANACADFTSTFIGDGMFVPIYSGFKERGLMRLNLPFLKSSSNGSNSL